MPESYAMDTEQASLPRLVAMAVCDMAIRDMFTGKLSLIGLFSTIQTAEFPCVHPTLTVYVALTNFDRPTPLSLRLFGPGGNGGERRLIGIEKFSSDTDVPTVVMDGTLTLDKLPFDYPGLYEFELYADERLLGDRKFFVSLLHEGGENTDDRDGADASGKTDAEQNVQKE